MKKEKRTRIIWREQIIGKYRAMELAKKIMALLFGISALQIVLILVISSHLSTTIITEQAGKLINENMKQNAVSIRSALERYDSMIQEIYTDTTYVDNMKIINSWDGEEYYLSMHLLNSKMQDLIYRNDEIAGIALIGKYGDECYYDRVTKSDQESICFEEHMGNNMLVKQALTKKDSVYSALLGKEDLEYGSHSFFYIAHQLTDFNNYEKGAVGCVVICIDEEKFRSTYSQGTEENSLSFVIDGYGNIVSMPEAGFEGSNIYGESPKEAIAVTQINELEKQIRKFVEEKKVFPRKNLDIHTLSIWNGQFYIINLQDLNHSMTRVRYLLIMICLVAALVGVIGFMVIYYISIDIDHSVKKILYAMKEANEGNLDSKIEVTGSDEFAKISQNFNIMLGEIKKANEQERESLLREKNAEIRSLEAQINPHFIYNTLDAVNWLAIEEQQFAISKMVTKLAQILRYTIHNSNEIVTLETELDYLKKYIYLQQERFEYSFDCDIEVEEQARKCQIHKLLLQPFVENSIIHGFAELDRRGEIGIRIQLTEEHKIYIEISDNGIGMQEEELKKLNDYDYRSAKPETSIGIRNVITRIKLYYGGKGKVRFLSRKEGTTVEITIPAERRD